MTEPGPPRPLIFTEDDVSRINRILVQFQKTTRCRANVLADSLGRVFTQVGNMKMAPETLAALVACSHAATREVAAILPRDEFVSLTHTGPVESVQLTHVHGTTLLATVYDQKTTVHVVMFYLKGIRDELAAIVREVAERKGTAVSLASDFKDSADLLLDDMFDEKT